MAWFRARFRAHDIYEITGEALERRGFKLLLADLDNTLVPYKVTRPSEETVFWKEELEARGIRLFLLSNSRKPGRAQKFAEQLGIPFQGHSGKPKKAGYLRAMERMGCTPAQTVMVGDQIFTDIWGANRAGITSVLVKPISWGKNPFRRLRYAIETPFRLLAMKK